MGHAKSLNNAPIATRVVSRSAVPNASQREVLAILSVALRRAVNVLLAPVAGCSVPVSLGVQFMSSTGKADPIRLDNSFNCVKRGKRSAPSIR